MLVCTCIKICTFRVGVVSLHLLLKINKNVCMKTPHGAHCVYLVFLALLFSDCVPQRVHARK